MENIKVYIGFFWNQLIYYESVRFDINKKLTIAAFIANKRKSLKQHFLMKTQKQFFFLKLIVNFFFFL